MGQFRRQAKSIAQAALQAARERVAVSAQRLPREARRLLEITGKRSLDLMHGYPEDAIPHWDAFRRCKEEGLTRYIGVARHRSVYYEMMMKLMATM